MRDGDVGMDEDTRNLAILLFGVMVLTTYIMTQVSQFITTGAIYLGLSVLSYLGLTRSVG